MRARTGCQPCREQHVKCVWPQGLDKCKKCFDTSRNCIKTVHRSFRPVTSVRLKKRNGRTTKHDLRHDASQVWMNVPSTVTFISPESPPNNQDETSLEIETRTSLEYTGNTFNEFESVTLSHSSPHGNEQINRPHQNSETLDIQNLSTISIHSHDGSPTGTFRSRDVEQNSSSSLVMTASPEFSIHHSWPFSNVKEARLFHHYILHVAPWLDVCDPKCHFGKEVPKRVAYYPVIANAIFAVASKHLSLLSSADNDDSQSYVSLCLPILIATLEDPFGHWDENLLAAVILLRTHEEMSDVDAKCHLFGTVKLLNSIASLAADGGLRESASWVSLRQHIYITLTSQQVLSINLENYRDSSAFSEINDESWANRIIFIFARILVHVLRPHTQQYTQEWKDLKVDVDDWHLSKPWYFCPLYIEQSKSSQIKPWPELLLAHPAQVVGLQYYCLSKIVLSMYDPKLSEIGFGTQGRRKASENEILEHLRMVIGLAVSNDSISNAKFQASHILATCGSYLSEQHEQDAAVDYLVNMQNQMGWRTSHIVEKLQQQWHTTY